MNDAPVTPPEPPARPSGVDFLYRVYCVRDEMPKLEKLLGRLMSGNPYNPAGSFIFPPGKGLRRLQDALGASQDYFVMGYERAEKPELFSELEAALPEQARGFEEQDRLIARDAKLCVVLHAQIKSPENNDFVETLVHLADAFRDLLLGVVWDVRMGKVFGHVEWRERVMEEPFSVLNHVAVRARGGRIRTHGLRKFGSPDLVVDDVPADMVEDVSGLLRDIAEHLTQGELLGENETIDYGLGKIRLVAAPAAAAGEDELLALVDDDESAEKLDAGRGLGKLIAAMKADREGQEGRRAGGGKGAG